MAGGSDGTGKKLAEAAHYWAGLRYDGTLLPDEGEDADEQSETASPGFARRQLERLGAPEEVLRALREQQEAVESKPAPEEDAGAFELWPDAVESWKFFMSLCRSGQWTLVGGDMGPVRRTGMPAERILAVMSGRGIRKKERRRLFEDMEHLVGEVLYADALVRQLRAKEK